jgi:hypothetical protein
LCALPVLLLLLAAGLLLLLPLAHCTAHRRRPEGPF